MTSDAVMWRGFPLDRLPLMDEQDWPAQPHTLPIPNAVLREAAAVSDVAAFLAIGEAWSQMVSHYLPDAPAVLDLGCGCGKQARFLALNPALTYVGIDLFLPGILWCRRAFAPLAERFRFEHFNGISEVYNPGGDIKASEYVFPLDDGSIDMTMCASLFTHLFEADARHYLSEIARVAKPGGRAIISIHIEPSWGTHYSGDEARIDIDEAYFVQMCEAAGLAVEERIGVIYGQTAYLLRKGGTSAVQAKSQVSRVGRAVRQAKAALSLKKGA